MFYFVVVLFRGEPFDKSVIHAVETVVIEWSHQIKDVLKKDSFQPVLEGLNPSPFVELDYWDARYSNLECIFDQLQDPRVRKMAELLERTQSSYFPFFKQMFIDVRTGKLQPPLNVLQMRLTSRSSGYM